MPYPGLVHEDHKILGSEYCSGFSDVFGKWNTGFYCPQTGSTSAVFCCGTSYFKYCCTTKPTLEDEDQDETAISPYTVRIPVFFAIFCGVLAVVILLITAICFFCSCCVVYKKRRDAASSLGLYRIQGSSSTASALASIYSNQNNGSVVTTPLDTGEWTTQLPVSAYIPYPFAQSTPLTSSYPSSATIPHASYANVPLNNNNSNNIPAFYYNNFNTLNNNNSRSQFSSLSNLQQYQRPLSALSTVSTYSSNSTAMSFPLQQQQQQQRLQNGYCMTNLPSRSQQQLQQGYFYRQLAAGQVTSGNLQQQAPLNSFSNPCPFPAGEANTRQQSRFINQNNNNARHLQQQHNGYQQSLPYNNNNTASGMAMAASSAPRPRTQGNHLNQQQQERLATVQSLINAYRANSSMSAPGGTATGTTSATRNRPASLTNMDVNRLNAINLLVSAVLNQNRRSASPSGNNTNVNANGVIRASGSRGESTSTTPLPSDIPTTTSNSNAPPAYSENNSSATITPVLITNKSSNEENSTHIHSDVDVKKEESINLTSKDTNEEVGKCENNGENPNSNQNIATSVPLILVENDYEKGPDQLNSKSKSIILQDGDSPDDNSSEDIISSNNTNRLLGESDSSIKRETSVSVNEFSQNLQMCHIEQSQNQHQLEQDDDPTKTKTPLYSKETLSFSTDEDIQLQTHVTNNSPPSESCEQEV